MLSGKEIKTDKNFTFSEHTTYGLGGRANVAYFPKSEEEGIEVFKLLENKGENFIILGNGSNVLASDSGFNGSVICTQLLNGISHTDGKISCQSGVTVKKLLDYCIENGLGGLEYLAGIPASVGGLVYMNGGINCRHLGDDTLSVSICDGNLRKLYNKDCNFGNKHSTMRDINAFVLGIELKVKPTDCENVRKNINYFLNLRKIQPNGKSCGCVFKNPEGFSAGRLIDEAGLKGLRNGGAEVSKKHANFIINDGASANDVYGLIKEVKRRVYIRFGVNLEEEVIYIGEFNVNGTYS